MRRARQLGVRFPVSEYLLRKSYLITWPTNSLGLRGNRFGWEDGNFRTACPNKEVAPVRHFFPSCSLPQQLSVATELFLPSLPSSLLVLPLSYIAVASWQKKQPRTTYFELVFIFRSLHIFDVFTVTCSHATCFANPKWNFQGGRVFRSCFCVCILVSRVSDMSLSISLAPDVFWMCLYVFFRGPALATLFLGFLF